MADWQVISPEETTHSAIAPGGIWGWPYLFVRGKPNSQDESRIWLGTAVDNKMNSGSLWKWNMKWKAMMDGPEVLTDVAPAVGAAWGIPVVFIRRKTDGAIFYSNYKMSQATPWQQIGGGTTDRALAATGVVFDGKGQLYVFKRTSSDNKIYHSHTSDSGDVKNWSPWVAIPGDFETTMAPAAVMMNTPSGFALVVFAKRKDTNRISYTFSLNGIKWNSWTDLSINQKFIETVQHLAPTAARYKDKIYVPYRPVNEPGDIIQAAVFSEDTRKWNTTSLCSAATSTSEKIAIGGYGDNLFLFHYSVSHGQVVVQHANI